MVDCAIGFLGGGSSLSVWVPFLECLVWLQAKVLQGHESQVPQAPKAPAGCLELLARWIG